MQMHILLGWTIVGRMQLPVRSEDGKNNGMCRLVCSAVRWIRKVSNFMSSVYFKGGKECKGQTERRHSRRNLSGTVLE